MLYTPTDFTRANETILRMEEIIRNEMLTHDVYVTEVVREDLADAGAVCGGRQACAVGSLWLAYGVRGAHYELPGVTSGERPAFLRKNPALRLAYEELNAAARRYAQRHIGELRRRHPLIDERMGVSGAGVSDEDFLTFVFQRNWGYSGELEMFFERILGSYDEDYTVTRETMLKITKSARDALRRRLRKQEAEAEAVAA